MSIPIWTAGELFTLRIYKRLTNRPDVLWANSYELFADVANTSGDLAARQVATSVAIWESQFHLTDVQFDRAVFSTFVPDGQPYDPDNFVSVGLTDVLGKRGQNNSESQPLQVCLLARRVVSWGRNGRLLYRRCLTELDVASPSGTPALTSAARTEFQGLLAGPWDGSAEAPGIVELLDTVYNVSIVMAGDPGNAPNVREIDEFEAVGVTIKKYNNAFYNRRTPPVAP